MSQAGRISVFITVALSIWALVHLYVFGRVATVPWVVSHLSRRMLITAAVILWASYPLARILSAKHLTTVAWPVEFVAATWIGVLFLAFSMLLITDIITLGGFLWPRVAPMMRGWAVLAALALSCVALVQGLRPPVVRDYEVRLKGLPAERDGLVIVMISDAHLGTLIGDRWLTHVVERVNGMKPDLIAVVGDLVDGRIDHAEELLPTLRTLRAPIGVWAVTGNHEYYAGIDRCVKLLEDAGFNVLRDSSAEVVTGLVLTGVDDLTTRRNTEGFESLVGSALAGRPGGATIFLSHSPLMAEQAAAAGADLMLSGHTHNGQIWPFNYLVRLSYRLLAGRYEVDGMTAIVCRGTGTWGPRMRLWLPGEILRIRLRSENAARQSAAPRR